MPKFKPLYGILIVATFVAGMIWLGSRSGGTHQQVLAEPDGAVHIDVSDLGTDQVRFYRFLSTANQEVDFFLGRDATGTLHSAFDASENHYKLRRGYSFQNGWIVDNKCGSSFRLAGINAGGGGCSPIPLPFRTQGDTVLIAQDELLKGWRLFN
ncbi:MAG TPA: hypothetical protein DD490_14225 [Acidobacteria bacterium]|nr:hypothetical protein [Acidobacteriota bacterium]